VKLLFSPGSSMLNMNYSNILIFNEVLYFLFNKQKTTTTNLIADISATFFKADDISNAKNKLWNAIEKFECMKNVKPVRRRDSKKEVDDTIAYIKACDNAGENLPLFFSTDMSKLPQTKDGTASIEQVLANQHEMQKKFVTIDFLTDY
jgi:hypothetical protein